MAYVPGFEWDVFVSFANNDNDAVDPEDKWVNRFVQDMKIGLRNWIGNADDLKVFFEEDSIGANTELPKLLQYARQSAIFVAVVSPSFLKRGWPLHEVDAFRSAGSTSDRLFVVECRPAGEYAQFPKNLRDVSAAPFFVQDRGARAPRPLSPWQDARDWANRMSELTKDMGEVLQRLNSSGAGAQLRQRLLPQKDAAVSSQARTILLAQTTDDLAEEYEDVRRYLTQAGHTVLPHHGLFPQGGAEFKEAFKYDLGRSSIYVQLLGAARSRRDPALPEGYARFQFATVQSEMLIRPELKRLCWRPIYLDLTQVNHEDSEILQHEAVVAMTLESFKREVLATIERQASLESGNALPGKSLTIYINAAPDDREIAAAVSDECARQGFTTVMQASETSALELFREVKRSFGVCNAYFLIYGKADSLWAIRQGASFSKISAQYPESELPRMIAIIDGPPEEKSLPPIRLPRSLVVNCRTSLDPVRQILSGLQQ